MKITKRAIIAATVASILAAGSTSVSAMTENQATSIKKEVASVPPVELAAKAVELVKASTKADKEQTAVLITTAVAKRSPSAVAMVFSAITSVAPELTVKLAATIVELLPDQAATIARLAVQASPADAGQIVAAMTKAAPKQAEIVSQSVKTTVAVIKAQPEQSTTLSMNSDTRAFPPGSGGKVVQVVIPINPRLKFPTLPPKDVSNYSRPGFDPNRP